MFPKPAMNLSGHPDHCELASAGEARVGITPHNVSLFFVLLLLLLLLLMVLR
jgi:hypothetical protein